MLTMWKMLVDMILPSTNPNPAVRANPDVNALEDSQYWNTQDFEADEQFLVESLNLPNLDWAEFFQL